MRKKCFHWKKSFGFVPHGKQFQQSKISLAAESTSSYLLVISFVFFIENIDSLLKTALKKNWYLSSKNVGKRDYSGKWNTDRVVLLQLRSTKDRLHCCIFSSISSFIGWKYLYWNNCLQDEIPEKASQLFYCKHGHVRSGVSDFHASSWCSFTIH